ncbi:VID27 cytoplasmic protein [Colletotrichum asianum]
MPDKNFSLLSWHVRKDMDGNGRLSLLGSHFRITAALLQRASLSASHPLTKLRHVEIRSELRAPAAAGFGLAADGNLRLKTSSGLLLTLVVHTTASDADLDQFEFEEEHPIPPARDPIHSPTLTRSIDSSMPQTPPKAANLLPMGMMTALFAPHLAPQQSHLNAPLQDA